MTELADVADQSPRPVDTGARGGLNSYDRAMATLEQRIATRLHAVLDHQVRTGISSPTAQRGMAVGGPDAPEIVLTVEDVARLAAIEAEGNEEAP